METLDTIYIVKLCDALRKSDTFIFTSPLQWIKHPLIRYYREMEIPQKPLVIDDWIKMSYKTSRIVYLFIPAARMYLVPSSTQLTQILEGQLAHNGVIQSGTTLLSLQEKMKKGDRTMQLYDLLGSEYVVGTLEPAVFKDLQNENLLVV